MQGRINMFQSMTEGQFYLLTFRLFSSKSKLSRSFNEIDTFYSLDSLVITRTSGTFCDLSSVLIFWNINNDYISYNRYVTRTSLNIASSKKVMFKEFWPSPSANKIINVYSNVYMSHFFKLKYWKFIVQITILGLGTVGGERWCFTGASGGGLVLFSSRRGGDACLLCSVAIGGRGGGAAIQTETVSTAFARERRHVQQALSQTGTISLQKPTSERALYGYNVLLTGYLISVSLTYNERRMGFLCLPTRVSHVFNHAR